MTTNEEANRRRMCLDCGAPGARLLTDRTKRILRICDACLRKDDWHRFGLLDREPFLAEVPTEYVGGEWCWPTVDGAEPVAVITFASEPSTETGHAGWCWWALGDMGDARTYDEARRKAETSLRNALDPDPRGAVR